MRIWEIKGYVAQPGIATFRFTTRIDALDRSSAVALVRGTYGTGPTQKINISSIRDIGKSKLLSN
jgi:hypothetical protein